MSVQVPPRARRSMQINDRRVFRWINSGIRFHHESGRI